MDVNIMKNLNVLILISMILLALTSLLIAGEILHNGDKWPLKLTETSGNLGGSNSGWQTSSSYTDTGLTAATTYTYRLRTSDALNNTDSYFSSQSATTATTGSTNIKVFSFNIAGDDKNWERRKSACYDLINTRKPDVIGFQELLPENLQWVFDNIPELGWYGLTIEGSSEDFSTDVEGESCRIMYNTDRFSVDSSNSGAFWFSATSDVPSEGWDDLRYCVYVRLLDINTGDGIYLYNTHWSFSSQKSRTNAAQIMMDRISSRAHTEDPFIVTGDFNAKSGDAGIQILLQNMTTVMENRIDWIFAESGKYELVSSEIISDIGGIPISDHDVLSADLMIK
jgi:endonuclease/exonuclease/phosphatase family metal-dependent hydrolase